MNTSYPQIETTTMKSLRSTATTLNAAARLLYVTSFIRDGYDLHPLCILYVALCNGKKIRRRYAPQGSLCWKQQGQILRQPPLLPVPFCWGSLALPARPPLSRDQSCLYLTRSSDQRPASDEACRTGRRTCSVNNADEEREAF